ncbi:MAG: tetraacyldisaccharide 4'-kinase [Candidatus Omnitrophica bacterium]|nr:tetraacyldisaccharide 4'-kinase [Candidatus Omnitrophota bacterium]
MAHLQLFLYTILYLVAFPFVVFFWILRKGRVPTGWKQRLGWERPDWPAHPQSEGVRTYWVHAVSVGEAMAAGVLMRALREREPLLRFVLTTVTETGQAVARRAASEADVVCYVPFDLPPLVHSFIRFYKPEALFLMETEIWPGLIGSSHLAGLPVCIANGRLSPKSFASYLEWRILIGPWLHKISVWAVQSEADQDRVLKLGIHPERVHVSGNLKYAVAPGSKGAWSREKDLGLAADHVLWMCGSTHEPEEFLIAKAYLELKSEYPQLRLFLVPRHVERFGAVESQLRKLGLSCLRWSAFRDKQIAGFLWEDSQQVVVGDTVGELFDLYANADLVFVGGSLLPHGGQNPIEAAYWGKPVCFGPHMINFRDVARQFVNAGAAVQVGSGPELVQALGPWLGDAAKRREAGRAGHALVQAQSAVAQKTCDALRSVSRPVRQLPAWEEWAPLLRPLSWIYALGIDVRNHLYERGWLPSVRLDAPVLSVGNLSCGGTGKTPMVALLARWALDRGKEVLVLSRGYGSAVAGQSDEVEWLRARVPEARVVAHPNRALAGAQALEQSPADLVILDDGFQHRCVKRDLDLVLLDATRPFYADQLLPAGTLRESKTALRRATHLCLTRVNEVSPEQLERMESELRELCPSCVPAKASVRPRRLWSLVNGKTVDLQFLNSKHIGAMSGIGNPQSFETQLIFLGGRLEFTQHFRDHHPYSAYDLRAVAAQARDTRAEAVVCTEKDAVKCVPLIRTQRDLAEACEWYALEVEWVIEEGEEALIQGLENFGISVQEKV